MSYGTQIKLSGKYGENFVYILNEDIKWDKIWKLDEATIKERNKLRSKLEQIEEILKED